MPRPPKPTGRGAAANPAGRFEAHTFERNEELPPDQLPKTLFFKDPARKILTRNDSPDVGFNIGINPYRGCEHGCVYCLDGETPVLMADGTPKPIKDLQPGDAVIGTTREGRYRRYTKTWVMAQWSVVKPAYKVSLQDGRALTAGEGHRFLTDRGWRYVDGPGPRLAVNQELMGLGKSRLEKPGALKGEMVKGGPGLRVAAIEPLGERPLYDIKTMSEDFLAAGVVSHNCYARPTHEYLGLSAGVDFESKIFVKADAPALLREELMSPRYAPETIAISGVTDCYQPVERRTGLTRGCLQVLAEFRNPVAIITKNALVTRDADLLAGLARHNAAAVYISVTSLDESLARRLEPRASRPAERLKAVETLAKAGVPVGVMVAPLIPGLTDHEIPRILSAARAAGAVAAGRTILRLPHGVKDIFSQWLDHHFPERKNKILNRIRDVRGGKLNDARPGTRMTGEGFFADEIHSLFALALRKAGFPEDGPRLSAAAFRRPTERNGQLPLF